MRLFLLFSMMITLLVAGCSLTDTESASGSAGLRLLVGTNGISTSLSHPEYDDWSPCMVNWRGTNYLYFLSTRPLTNGTQHSDFNIWDAPASKNNTREGIFRARQLSPGVFTDLQLFYTATNNQIHFKSITVFSNSGYVPYAYVHVEAPEPIGTNISYIDTSLGSASLNPLIPLSTLRFMGGINMNLGNPVLCVGMNVHDGFEVPPIAFNTLRINCLSNNFIGGMTGLNVRDRWRIDRLSQSEIDTYSGMLPNLSAIHLNDIANFDGASPGIFPDPFRPDQMHFGFYTSMNGVLFIVVYTDCSDFVEYVNNNQTGITDIADDPSLLFRKLFLPLITITHYPGTMDKNPSYYPGFNGNDEGKGLYFASNREGKGRFNLYFVPTEYLKIPPEFLADLPPLP